MRYLPVVVLVIAGWLFLSAAAAGLISPVARRLKESRAEERRVALSVEDQTPDDLMTLADVLAAPLPDDVCCDMHNRHCEPASELCCWRCTETQHTLTGPHADGSECVMDFLHPEDAPTCYRDGLFPNGVTYHDIWPAPVETYGQERLYAPQCRSVYPITWAAGWVCTRPPHSSTEMHSDGPVRWDEFGDVYAAMEATS